MRKDIINAVFNRISNNVPEVKFIDLWNEHLADITGGASWPMPAVFIEFEEIQWRQEGLNSRRADVGLRLHIITQAVNTSSGHTDNNMQASLEYFDLIDRITSALQGLHGDNFSPLMLSHSATNHNHAELIESIERFVFNARDISAKTSASTTQISNLAINK
ncbi:MAG: hypothetical protein IKZ14_07770 [Muribaculaceae bacterium]|nr:hypothetical protein [Muribaculaceae bacterium]